MTSLRNQAENAPLPPADKYVAPEQPRINSVLASGPIAGQIADLLTTVKVLKNGGREANPMMRKATGNIAIFAAIKLGIGLGMSITAQELAHHNRKTLAKVAAALGTAAGIGPAIHNIEVMQHQHKS